MLLLILISNFRFGFFLCRLPGLWIFWWLDGNCVHHDVSRHIVGQVLCDSAPSERGRENYQTAGQGVDWPDMDVWVLVLHHTGNGPGVQPIRTGRIPN